MGNDLSLTLIYAGYAFAAISLLRLGSRLKDEISLAKATIYGLRCIMGASSDIRTGMNQYCGREKGREVLHTCS